MVIALFFIAGPQMMIAMHHQAIGDASSAALLSLTKPYLLAIPLTFGLAAMLGENGIWIAAPLSELLLMALTTVILAKFARRRLLRWGLFHPTSTVRT